MRHIVRMCEPSPLGIYNQPDVALPIERHSLRFVLASPDEAHRLQECGKPRRLLVASGEFDELDSCNADGRRQVGHREVNVRLGPLHIVHQREQRTLTVDRDRLGRAATKLIVEDLQRQYAVIAGGGDSDHEVPHG